MKNIEQEITRVLLDSMYYDESGRGIFQATTEVLWPKVKVFFDPPHYPRPMVQAVNAMVQREMKQP